MRVSKEPGTFFRLSPAAIGTAQCFAVRRGEVKQRIDVKFILHGGHQTLANVETVSLGSLTVQEPDYGSGSRAIAMQSPDDVKYIRITDFNEDGIPVGHEFVTAEVVDDEYALEHEDVLFARSGATAGKTFIYTNNLDPAIFAGYCIRFRFDTERVLPPFVYFYTKTNRYRAWVKSIQRPSGQPNINKQEFKSFGIPLPSVEVQQALVAEMDAARSARQEKFAQADALLAGFDKFLLDQLGLVEPPKDSRQTFAVRLKQIRTSSRLNADYYHPERILAVREQERRTGLRAERLSDIADFMREAVTAYSLDDYIGLANVQSNTGELVMTQDETVSGLCFEFAEGDVLFARLRPYLNKVHRAERGGICSPEFHVMRVRPALNDKDEVLPDYLATVLRSSLVLAQTKHMMTGNTHPRLANEDVVNLVVPIPKRDVQKVIAAEVQRRRTQARLLREEAATEWAAAKARFESRLLGAEA